MFPLPIRPRRARLNASQRALLQETRLHPSQLVLPLFIRESPGQSPAIDALPDQQRYLIEELPPIITQALSKGIVAVALFPCLLADKKTPDAAHALDPDTLILRATRFLRQRFPELIIITDVALDPYTSHGHDGLLDSKGQVDNDATLEILAQQALLQAQAGATWVAPSDMMDGRVKFIRDTLDQAGYTQTCILSYSAKFASAFYGPFRNAIGSDTAAGTLALDKKTYQLPYTNPTEALRDALLDVEEGADALLVKPAGHYLDIIFRLRQLTHLPVAAYQVSGEYLQICATAQAGWIDRSQAILESLYAIRRAGAQFILTYFALEAAALLKE
ncbi:MAG: porphobilinogen synthase [Methylacidiphilales bacterium]|nr:porphobilinogen synthase [Candidatus Methylacidiphilales bacterium]MDW8348718.1 porphobilinogen synthase [Verrucomicrobiae bacterium]